MKTIVLLLSLALATVAQGAENTYSIKDYCHGAYSPKSPGSVTPLADGESYAQLSPDHKQILVYSFKTGKQTGTLFDAGNIKGRLQINGIDGYQMSPDESNILLRTKTQGIYRRSFTAEYYIYNVKARTLAPLSENGPQEQPLWSPDGNLIAFVRDNNLFLVKLLFGNSESQITKDGEYNHIINGKPDWVNEEEFLFARAFDFNADNTMLAWIRYDESQVPLYAFPWFKGSAPEKKQYADYPGSYNYKYPIAGQTNSTVKVQTFDIKSRTIRDLQLPLPADGYIPRIKFTSHPEKLLVLTQNRHQNQLDIYVANPRSTECRCIVRDQAEHYISDDIYPSFHVLPNSFVLMSERSGYKHLYLYDFNGTLQRQLTSGNYEVKAFHHYDEKTGTVTYTANAEGPLYQAVYATDAKGKTTKLSTQKGFNSATFSTSGKYFINQYSSLQQPPVYTLCDSKGKTLTTLEDNQALRATLANLPAGESKFFTFQTSDGIELNGLMVLPPNFNPANKYPVIMHQYSGPGSQSVLDQWSGGHNGYTFMQCLAQKGFIAVVVDGRGTGGRGRDFEQCTYLKLGQIESHDQAEAALYLATLPYVDGSHIGIWGWSYGGFNTLMSMSEGRNAFAAGVAVAPPTSWYYYDTIYSERYMQTPNENPDGYNINPIALAPQLHGHLLIIHGMADDNVHFRNTAEYTEALVQADKDYKLLAYTNRDHSIYGGNTRYHLTRQVVQWFEQYLTK